MKCLIKILSVVASHSPHGLVAYLTCLPIAYRPSRWFTMFSLNHHDGYWTVINKKNIIKYKHWMSIQIFEIIMLSFDCLK